LFEPANMRKAVEGLLQLDV